MRIYAAGKIGKNDWRGPRRAPWGIGIDYGNIRDYLTDFEVEISPGVIYVGPWFISCDHGCYHGDNCHGVGAGSDYQCSGDVLNLQQAKRDTLRNSLHQIRKADVFYARLDSREAFGTFTEIGYSLALGKPVYIDVPPGCEALLKDMWFMLQMSLSCQLNERQMKDIPFWSSLPESLDEYRRRLQHVIGRGDWTEDEEP